MKLINLLILSVVMTTVDLSAGPVFRRTMLFHQPDGSSLRALAQGNEGCRYLMTADSVPLLRGSDGALYYFSLSEVGVPKPSIHLAHDVAHRSVGEWHVAQRAKSALAAHLSAAGNWARAGIGDATLAAVPVVGSPAIPVFLVQFPDRSFSSESSGDAFTCDAAFFDAHFNAVGYTDEGGPGSVRDYFVSQSYGQFTPTFDVYGPFTLSNPRAYYCDNNSFGDDRNVSQMCSEALHMLLALGVDVSPYCIPGTSTIRLACLVCAGEGENETYNSADVYPAYRHVPVETNDGYTIGASVCVNEVARFYGTELRPDGIGTFCHEFSHALGLPDMYNQIAFGLDEWDIMDYGLYLNNGASPVGYSAYERYFMGWLPADTLAHTPQSVDLTPLEQGGATASYRIMNLADETGNEYYMLENRQPGGWFPSSHGSGMLVYHINYSEKNWRTNRVNYSTMRPDISIVPADGRLTSAAQATSNDSYKGDFYPGLTGNRSLSDTSVPPANAYVGELMHFSIDDIQAMPNGNIRFAFMSERVTGLPHDVATLPLAAATEVAVYNMRGEYVARTTYDGLRAMGLPSAVYILRTADGRTMKIRL